MFDLNSLKVIKIGLASPEDIYSWGKGEVTKPETINYRTLKPEPDGLFCQKIFGPVKDYECYCGKLKKRANAGQICDKCGVESTLKSVRRERMGYIKLAVPCAHIWYVKGSPSKIGLTLDIQPKQLEEVVYFVSNIVLNPGSSKILQYRQVLDERKGREIFGRVLQEEILDKGLVHEDDFNYAKIVGYVNDCNNLRRTYDFKSVSKMISRYLGAEFGSGAEAIQRLLKEIDLDKEIEKVCEEMRASKSETNQKRVKAIKRLEVLESFKKTQGTANEIKPEWMILTVIPVIPPELRPMMQLDGGRFATSDINDLYRQVIIKNNRLKKEMEEHAPSVILLNEKRMLQDAVDALLDNDRRNKPSTSNNGTVLKCLSSSLKGKQGRFRQNLLGKRVDYSGRSVIAVGPELNMDECGLPREMAIQLFEPFIAHELISDPNSGVTSGKQVRELIAKMDPRVFDAVEKVAVNHPVLLNRAPTLHRLGIQAFRPKLIDGKAIRLHPLVCPGFNADFDGDQMAVHVPLSKQSQIEAMTLMLANKNILKPSDGKPICVPSQDMIFGNYYLTLEDDEKINEMYAKYYEKRDEPDVAARFRSYDKYEGKVFSDPQTAILAYQNGLISLHTRIYVPGHSLGKTCLSLSQNNSYLLTTVGKLIFNSIFPNDFPYINFPFKDAKKDVRESEYNNNFHQTPDSFFVTVSSASQYVREHNSSVQEGFDPFREYCKLQPMRAPIDKGGIQTMMDYVFRKYGAVETARIMDAFKNQGFDYCTKSGLTISLDDITALEGRKELYEQGDRDVANIEELYEEGFMTADERHDAIIKYWTDLKDKQMSKLLDERMARSPRNPMFMMMESGARGSKDNYMQLIGMKGCMLDSTGRAIEIPVKSCYAEGLSVSEYFTSTHGTRKNGADTALKTADSGYLTRKLVDVSHNVVIREENCHCDHGVVVSKLRTDNGELISTLYDRLVGRFTMHDVVDPNTGEIIAEADTMMDEDTAQKIVDAGIKEVEIRSVLTCESKDGICVHCYGRNLATGQIAEIGDTVGIMAAQSIGEPGTQLTLKNFHTGGVAGQSDITTGLPRVTELLEARNTKAKDLSLITTIPGTVVSRVEEDTRYTFTVRNELEEKTFTSSSFAVPCVEEGEEVKAGQALTKGHINVTALLECTDLTTVRNYIIKEVKAVYASSKIAISDKHLEVIVRQMTNRLLIINAGDTDLLPGKKVNQIEFTEKNDKVLSHGGKPAVGRPIVMGITKAALDTDSFLSSASFQETTKVLTDAAIKGKSDYLVGLKENVMIGKLIPAGTGIVPLPGFEEEENAENAQQAAPASQTFNPVVQ